MNEKIKKTALETSAGTDEKQSLINSNNIITDEDDFCNSDDLFAEFREESNPNFIRTFTLGELFDKSYVLGMLFYCLLLIEKILTTRQ